MTPRLAAPGTTALLGMVAVWLVLGVGRLAAHDRPNGPLHKTRRPSWPGTGWRRPASPWRPPSPSASRRTAGTPSMRRLIEAKQLAYEDRAK